MEKFKVYYTVAYPMCYEVEAESREEACKTVKAMAESTDKLELITDGENLYPLDPDIYFNFA